MNEYKRQINLNSCHQIVNDDSLLSYIDLSRGKVKKISCQKVSLERLCEKIDSFVSSADEVNVSRFIWLIKNKKESIEDFDVNVNGNLIEKYTVNFYLHVPGADRYGYNSKLFVNIKSKTPGEGSNITLFSFYPTKTSRILKPFMNLECSV